MHIKFTALWNLLVFENILFPENRAQVPTVGDEEGWVMNDTKY